MRDPRASQRPRRAATLALVFLLAASASGADAIAGDAPASAIHDSRRTVSIGGSLTEIRWVSQEVGLRERGECLAGAVGQDLAALDSARAQIRTRIKVAFILSLANGRPMIAGRATAADGIITMAGADNAFADFDGYKAVNDEAIATARPDAVLVMQRGEHALTADAVFAQSALAMTPAAQHSAFVSMEGLYLLGFGPRTAMAARDLARQLYPDIAGGELPSERDAGGIQCNR